LQRSAHQIVDISLLGLSNQHTILPYISEFLEKLLNQVVTFEESGNK